VEDTITIGGKDFNFIMKKVKQIDLKFYPENPRIYSLLFNGEEYPDQYDIENNLVNTEHVKQLSQSIKANGGLIDPILIRDGDNVVLEGNCRLAAYRILAKEDAIKWGEIKCKVLPCDIDDDSIFKLLGQYHIIGRKDWAPFEQAGYLWRRKQKYEIEETSMATEMGIAVSRINRLISIYQFMLDNNDLNSPNWSYYEEYFKSSPLKRMRESLPELDKIIVKKINSQEFTKSNADIRNLSKIANMPGKDGKQLIKKFINEEKNLDELIEIAELKGADNTFIRKLNNFRVLINKPEIKHTIKQMPLEQLNHAEFELSKIDKRTVKLLKQLTDEKNKKKISEKLIKKQTLVKQNDRDENTDFKNVTRKDEESDKIIIKADLIPQFSNFDNGTINLVNILTDVGKIILSFNEIGEILIGQDKSDSAKKKYGENHSKLAELLGFVKINNNSPRGVIITKLGKKLHFSSFAERQSILINQILQMQLIKDLCNKDLDSFNLSEYLCSFLAESTAKRRYSNVKHIIKILADNKNTHFEKLYDSL